MAVVCTVSKHPTKNRSDAMNVNPLFVPLVIGVMNIKRIMKFVCVIDVMPFIVEIVMKWINVMTVVR